MIQKPQDGTMGKNPQPLPTHEKMREIIEIFQRAIDQSDMPSQQKALWREKVDETDCSTIQTALLKFGLDPSEITGENIFSILKGIF